MLRDGSVCPLLDSWVKEHKDACRWGLQVTSLLNSNYEEVRRRGQLNPHCAEVNTLTRVALVQLELMPTRVNTLTSASDSMHMQA